MAGLEDIAQGEGDLTRSLIITGHNETALLAGWFNQFLGTIHGMVSRMVTTSGELQHTSANSLKVASDMSDAAARQRQAVEMVSTAFNEMVATANEVARACGEAANHVDNGHTQVCDGSLRMNDATASIARLSENLSLSGEAVAALQVHSSQINVIVETIRSIADQTNLLALNAAIEAARAGAQGRGFTVVADEVRALAKRSSDATGEIGQLLAGLTVKTDQVTRQIQNSMSISSSSVGHIEQARLSFERIRTSVEQIREQSTHIATAAEEQHAGAEDMNRHVAQIHADAQLVEGLSHAAKQDAGRLQGLSNHLNELAVRFKT
ncbi:methyl-accepting chemotaxis protein [Pseudomonas sp. NPDC008258]|uniref:methyl-accepting chemotaxis protein n=1 Tax=Pseudomonas sp. NPDC008258 TaxID=3364418 RepID=UPI0036EFADB5